MNALLSSPPATSAPPFAAVPAGPVRRLFVELTDLKRIESFGHPGSLASYRFGNALERLVRIKAIDGDIAKQQLRQLAVDHLTLGIIATRCGAMDIDALKELDIAPEVIERTFDAALDEHAAAIPTSLRDEVRQSLGRQIHGGGAASTPRPIAGDAAFTDLVDRMRREPRAGATAMGRSRVLVTPTESQAEHSYVTAILATILAGWSAEDQPVDAGECFATGMLHHVHNAYLPDSGFSGEVLLGDALPSVLRTARDRAKQAIASVADRIDAAADRMSHLETPESRCNNAADAIDRVLQSRYHERVANFDSGRINAELELVHEGPLQSFQQATLVRLGIEEPNAAG